MSIKINNIIAPLTERALLQPYDYINDATCLNAVKRIVLYFNDVYCL